jgi:hypothetical protein
LLDLDAYARERAAFRARVIAHKRDRTVAVGPHMTWIFEDRLTILYQVQEMLRIERLTDPADVQAELDTYNPLVPDGSNWKVTLLIEYPEETARRAALAGLRGVEDRCWVEVAGERRLAIADEDLERENDEKTSAVHWLRFELSPAARAAVHGDAVVSVGVDHPGYQHARQLPAATVRALARDLR